MEALAAILNNWQISIAQFLSMPIFAEQISPSLTLLTRFIYPLLALIIFIRCLAPILQGIRAPKPWAYLLSSDGQSFALLHWENSLGNSKNCDIFLNGDDKQQILAVLSRKQDKWYISDISGQSGIELNGQPLSGKQALDYSDNLKIGSANFQLKAAVAQPNQVANLNPLGKLKAMAEDFKPGLTLCAILLFQIIGLSETIITQGAQFAIIVPLAFIVFGLLQIGYYALTRSQSSRFIEPELLAFFLSGLGLFVLAVNNPEAMLKQTVSIFIGLFMFLIINYFLNNSERSRIARYVFASGALLLLALNIGLAEARFGARNWLFIGPISLQPSEFIKIAFVFAGAAGLEKLLSRQNLLKFMIFSGACIGGLILIRDLGSALIFFVAFMVMAFMRSGNMRLLILGLISAIMGALIVISFMPYIAERFESWGKAWEFAHSNGFQHTRTMIYTASGGLIGLGIAQGYLRYIAAADTDLVFGLLAEEWGLIIALIAALTPLILTIFVSRSIAYSRSAFYAIAASGAAAILLMQAALNIFGSLDILPLTGVTLPFISNGGSSMIACWGLLACIKSVDERHRSKEDS